MTTEALDLTTASNDDLKAMGLPEAFTLESLQATYTKEEIERLQAGDDPLFKPEPEEGDEGAGDDAAAAAGAGEVGGGAADEGAGDDLPEFDKTPDPVIEKVDVAGHQQVIDTAAAERKKLREEYTDGNLSDDELDEKMDALNDSVVAAKEAIKDAERTTQSQVEAYQNAWFGHTGTVMERNPAFLDTSPIAKLGGYSVAEVFDECCRTATSDARYNHLSLAQKAQVAEKMAKDYVKQRTGEDIAAASAPGKKADPAPKAEAKPTAKELVQKQGQRPEPVQTLGTITSASETEVENSRFAAVDNAKGLDSEAAFSRLSPAEQDAFLRGA